jgi:hypothetical protein
LAEIPNEESREGGQLEIVFVHWKILPGKEPDFKQHWRTGLPINDRRGLVGEFLSEPSGHAQYKWVNWDLRGTTEFTVFINVGLWADAESFHEQIGQYFNPAGGKLPFEFSLRQRALLTPSCWRMGDWKLPIHDSGGVL